MNLDTPLSRFLGVGFAYLRRLQKLNIETLGDLITHYPFRYDDFSVNTNILDAKIGEKVTLVGEIWSIKNVYTRSRKVLTQAIFNDGTSPIDLTWFNQSWLTKQISVGDRLQISGKLSKYKNKISVMAPVWEKVDSLQSSVIRHQTLHTGRLVPVYPETEGLSSKWLRTRISSVLPKILGQIEDPLPLEIRDQMLELRDAIEKIHFPENWEEAEKAKERLSFDELFFLQLATLKARLEWSKKPLIEPIKVSDDKDKIEEFISSLPFKLTDSQKKVLDEILEDLGGSQPMNRLVQGEVGSGKTVVAAILAYIAYLNNLKTFYMAPTEILAFQHQSTFQRLLEPFGLKIGIYTGSKKFTKLSEDQPDIIIGTHALLSEKLDVPDVGLIIVDEQQRFGVEQRTILRNKAKVPHFLTMTATPIPRTVALTLYGDLDLSIIDELPKGRKLVKTHVVPSKKRDDAYKFIRDHVGDGEQVYIITPLIEYSETVSSARAAKVEFERLKKVVFPDLRVGLLHGRLKSKEKEQVLNDFKDHKLDILVSTSVVEVGVDVSNATIMVIEGAERFGLAQLHQLRGRVGRGDRQSYCLLFPTMEEPSLVSRLKNLENIYDGLKLSELDLKIRGGGDIFGKRQSGRFELKIASFSDLELIEKTREKAKKLLTLDPELDKYPQIKVKLDSLISGAMPD